jgi:hypothetical protein
MWPRGFYLTRDSGGKFEASVAIAEDMGVCELLSEVRQARERGLDFGAFLAMQPLERLAWRWAISNTIAMDALCECSRARIVRYEDLCENPVQTSQSLLNFAGLTWNERTESFVKASTNFAGLERYYQVFSRSEKIGI